MISKKHLILIILFSTTVVLVLFFYFHKNKSDEIYPSPEINIVSKTPEIETFSGENPTTNGNLLLPDLEVVPLRDAYIVTNSDKNRIFRFPGTFANTGDGPLELASSLDELSNLTRATQHIYKKDGTKYERFVGNFVFHPTHGHWHFEDFVEFELLSLKDNSGPDQILVSTGKITFCLHDYAPLPDNFSGKPDRVVYPWCSSSADIQGISVGWVDTYKADVPGQELDISHLPDGVYAFRANVDPFNLIMEKNEENNSSLSFIEISGNNVRILFQSPAQELQRP